MLKSKVYLLLGLALTTSAIGGLAKKSEIPGYKLQLAEEAYLTDKNGVASPEQVINVQLGRLVKIYRTDGFCYTGRVTEIEESPEVYKVYGTVDNVEGARFGFVLAKGGVFAGAILDIKNDSVYAMELSELYKGYVLVRSFKHDKSSS